MTQSSKVGKDDSTTFFMCCAHLLGGIGDASVLLAMAPLYHISHDIYLFWWTIHVFLAVQQKLLKSSIRLLEKSQLFTLKQ